MTANDSVRALGAVSALVSILGVLSVTPNQMDQLRTNLKSANAETRQDAARRLGLLGADAKRAAIDLVKASGDEDEEVRAQSTAALEGLGPPFAAQRSELEKLLTSSDGDSAYWCVTLLGRLKCRESVQGLVAALQSTKAISVRQRAAWALGEIGVDEPSARSALEEATRAGDARLARLARDALEKLHSGGSS